MQDRRQVIFGLMGLADLIPRALFAASVPELPPVVQIAPLGRRVFAHWHIFRRSFDNAAPANDQYARYLSPEGSNGQYRNVGGFIRERPYPRPARSETDWAVLDCVDEIRLAEAAGIDGFQFNIGSVKRDSKLFWLALQDMLEASERVNSNFSILLSLDCAIIKPDKPVADLVDALVSVAPRARVARASDGRLLLGAFAAELWSVERWRNVLDGLSNQGHSTYFIPTFLNPREARPYLPLADGASVWGGNRFNQLPTIERFGSSVRELGKSWIAPVWSQDFRPKDGWFAEARNSELYREGWSRAIASNADAAAVITWNDYSESSEVEPSTGIQSAFYDLTSFYAKWFKAGKMPGITEDVLFYFHRTESTEWSTTGILQPRRFVIRFGEDARNEIELLALLTSPGRLEISTSLGVTSLEAQKGITSVRAPIAPGRPVFRLIRNGRPTIELTSAFEVRENSQYQDLLYHGGSSHRAPFENPAGR